MNNGIKYKGEFKNIDTPEKAYVLGLIYSDGCVMVYGKGSYRVSITLHEDDLPLLKII